MGNLKRKKKVKQRVESYQGLEVGEIGRDWQKGTNSHLQGE